MSDSAPDAPPAYDEALAKPETATWMDDADAEYDEAVSTAVAAVQKAIAEPQHIERGHLGVRVGIFRLEHGVYSAILTACFSRILRKALADADIDGKCRSAWVFSDRCQHHWVGILMTGRDREVESDAEAKGWHGAARHCNVHGAGCDALGRMRACVSIDPLFFSAPARPLHGAQRT